MIDLPKGSGKGCWGVGCDVGVVLVYLHMYTYLDIYIYLFMELIPTLPLSKLESYHDTTVRLIIIYNLKAWWDRFTHEKIYRIIGDGLGLQW